MLAVNGPGVQGESPLKHYVLFEITGAPPPVEEEEMNRGHARTSLRHSLTETTRRCRKFYYVYIYIK